jgi:hypothetical protein
MSSNKLQAAALGGLFIGVLSALPVVAIGNACCCLWVVSGGVLASYLLQQNQPMPITAADGALVGFFAGGIGAVVRAVISVPLNLLMGPMQRQMLQRILERSQDMPPEMRDWMTRFDADGMSLAIGVFTFFLFLFVSLIFATLGGLLGAAMFRKTVPAPPVPPESSPVA